MLADEKDGLRKIGSSREGAVLVDRCVTKSGRVRKKERDNEAGGLNYFSL